MTGQRSCVADVAGYRPPVVVQLRPPPEPPPPPPLQWHRYKLSHCLQLQSPAASPSGGVRAFIRRGERVSEKERESSHLGWMTPSSLMFCAALFRPFWRPLNLGANRSFVKIMQESHWICLCDVCFSSGRNVTLPRTQMVLFLFIFPPFANIPRRLTLCGCERIQIHNLEEAAIRLNCLCCLSEIERIQLNDGLKSFPSM